MSLKVLKKHNLYWLSYFPVLETDFLGLGLSIWHYVSYDGLSLTWPSLNKGVAAGVDTADCHRLACLFNWCLVFKLLLLPLLK